MTYPIESPSTGFAHRPSTCQPGCVRMLAYFTKEFHTGNDGCYNPNSVLQPSGKPSFHVYGKAVDAACNLYTAQGVEEADAVWDYVMAHLDDFQAQQMIAGHRIWDVSYGERIYHHDDHFNHVHLSVGYEASQIWTPSPGLPAPVELVSEDEMFRVIKGDVAKDMWLTNWLTKRHIGTPAEVNAIIAAGVTEGARPIIWPQAWVDSIPVLK